MQKDFDRWNEIKKQTDGEQPRLYTVREIWWCRLGVNVGTEQDGSGDTFLRPVVVLRAFGPEACLVVPLTTSEREHPLRVSVGVVDGRNARANLSQMKVVDTRRLVEKIGFWRKTSLSSYEKTPEVCSSVFSHSPSCEGEAEANYAIMVSRLGEKSMMA